MLRLAQNDQTKILSKRREKRGEKRGVEKTPQGRGERKEAVEPRSGIKKKMEASVK